MPFLIVKDYYILFDTGSSINLINKDYVYKNKNKFKIFEETFKFTTANGEHIGNQFVMLNIEGILVKCFLYNFHKEFNVLLGIPALIDLKIKLNFENNKIQILNKICELKFFNSKNNVNVQNVDTILIKTGHLNNEEKNALSNILEEYESIFPKTNEPLSHTSAIKHEIKTTDEIPIYSKSYRYPECYKEEISNQVNKLLSENIIRESYSPWSSPVWMVPKKLDNSGKKKYRMVIDYRKLNAKTIDDKFPIPNITDVLDKLGKNIYFTILDLASGFHQIEMDENSISKTAFNTDKGHFEFCRVPFGLKNAPATFQRLMNHVLRDYINKICLVYLDDIIILGTSLKEHIENIRKIFKRLKQYNLKIQIDKSEFLRKEVAYLGHIVSQDGIKPNPTKIEAVKNYPIPKTQKEIKSYLGLLGYYRKFIPDFSKLTKPLTKCLKKGNKININDKEYIESFEHSKEILTNAPLLQYPDFSKQFILSTDASDFAIGAILSQNVNGQDLPIAYASRTLNNHEINYSTTEKELLGIVWATKYFRPYLYGVKFVIRTDHQPLTWLMNLKDPSSKLMRWKIKLDEYSFDIEYKKGKFNTNADALSRIRPKFKILKTFDDIFDKPYHLVHCISKDKTLSKGFAKQINSIFKSKLYLEKKNLNINEICVQPIHDKYKLFHLVTKTEFYSKPCMEDINKCLIKLRDYCIHNDIFELHMPKICSGLDMQNFKEIENLIENIFQESHIQIVIHELKKEILVNDNFSIIARDGDNDSDTCHSADENHVNGISYKQTSVNVGRNQLIISTHNNPFKIEIKKLFGYSKQRFVIHFDKNNLCKEIIQFIKEFLVPKVTYYCIIDKEIILTINKILQDNFIKDSFKLIQCDQLLEDVENINDQIDIITNYHFGKTNHRGILETYTRLKRNYYWPKLYESIQKFINNCEICQENKYERRPFRLNDNLTETSKCPFDKIHIDVLTLEKKKYLTIIDAFSKFAQIYYIKTADAINITEALLDFFSKYKIPNEITYDSGLEFNNNLVKELLKIYKIKIHMISVDNPKSNGLIERFHSTLIEHLRIINQSNDFNGIKFENKLNFAILAYNNSINSLTKFTPNEILYGADKDKNILVTGNTKNDYLINYKDKLKILHDSIEKIISIEKIKRFLKQNDPDDKPTDLPKTILIKQGKRRIQKIKKPLFKIHRIETFNPRLRTIKIENKSKHKIDKIKRPRMFVTDLSAQKETMT